MRALWRWRWRVVIVLAALLVLGLTTVSIIQYHWQQSQTPNSIPIRCPDPVDDPTCTH
ncbi:MAG TPA: hypothetical protein VIN12_01415 [Candidatus Dormibacteraeota bacterium]|jgi:hypothetical protein